MKNLFDMTEFYIGLACVLAIVAVVVAAMALGWFTPFCN